MSKYLGAAICPALFALVGCPSPKPALTLAPVVQSAYIDGGGTLRWLPTGQPFKVFWPGGVKPCLAGETMVSDGTNIVTCTASNVGKYGGGFPYYVDKPPTAGDQSDKSVAKPDKHRLIDTKVVIYMHVGSCSNCSGAPIPSGDKVISPLVDADTAVNTVQVSCPNPGTTTLVDPLTGPSGLKVNDTVVFQIVGNNPPPDQPTLTFPANYCTGLPSPYQFVGGGGSCQISSAGTVTYKATGYGCNENSKPTLTATQ